MHESTASENRRFSQLLACHYAGVARFLRRRGLPAQSVDDVTQSSFLIAFEAMPRIADGCERAFLYATAVRVAYGLGRRSSREVAFADMDRDSPDTPAPDDLTHQKRARERLDLLLGCLERDSRAVFVRFEVDGLTISEIATDLAIPVDAAICRLRRARKQFRALVRQLALA